MSSSTPPNHLKVELSRATVVSHTTAPTRTTAIPHILDGDKTEPIVKCLGGDGVCRGGRLHVPGICSLTCAGDPRVALSLFIYVAPIKESQEAMEGNCAFHALDLRNVVARRGQGRKSPLRRFPPSSNTPRT